MATVLPTWPELKATEALMASDFEPDPDDLLRSILARPAWHRRAACRGIGPEAFFPVRGQRTDFAKEVCAGCPVRRECRAYAVANLDVSGIWGGTSHRERTYIKRGLATAS
jgi:hypothetical protein